MKRVFLSLALCFGLSLASMGAAFSQDLQKQSFSCLGENGSDVSGTMLLEKEFSSFNGYAQIDITEPGKPLKVIIGLAQQGMWTTNRLTIHEVQQTTGNFILTFLAEDYFEKSLQQPFSAQLIGNGFETLNCTRTL